MSNTTGSDIKPNTCLFTAGGTRKQASKLNTTQNTTNAKSLARLKNLKPMNDNILNNWQFLNAKAIELKTLTKATDPQSRTLNRARELVSEIVNTMAVIDLPEGKDFDK